MIQQPTPPELSDEPALLDSEFPGSPNDRDETLQDLPAIFDQPATDADASEGLTPTEQLTGEFPSTESEADPTEQFAFPTCTPQMFVRHHEAGRLDEIDCNPQARSKPQHGTGVLRNVGLVQS